MTAGGPGAMYETLARWQWLRARRRRGGEGLDMRKHLLAPPGGFGPADGGASLDRWLMTQLGERSKQGVVDFGCGFGASLSRWLAAGAARGVGVTSSAFQVRVATAAAARAGIGDRCAFVCQDFTAPLPERFDVALAIESLHHATDLAAALAAVRRSLRPGGVMLWIDDCLLQPAAGDADVAELAARWASPPLRPFTLAREALRAAGFRLLRETDLTPQVKRSPPAAIARRERALARVRAWLPLPPVRRLADAFLGGLALERLYARGLACYRVWMSERGAEVT